ncbi:DNA mismatch repair endonuclease MutL [Colwelliaceae bacterium BS250]
MSIAVLPARLANQIAAGEVVERPASVVKELVENSIDAGATNIVIDIEQGGAKRIKISDNGAGIVKDELSLALSRHATSKIKNLDDLESINSLGFRGEALASISSVSRLTLTSMPEEQDTAWQAIAVGRDMAVDIKPAAHPKGTTIDVEDLFFNTPARRKFLRTEKTEFTHIDEVVRRIALSTLSLSLTLIHNGKTVRQYRSAKTDKQIEKRIASVCGQAFIDNAIALDFKHDNLHLWGWIAKPSFYRSQNDLSYSYVNGRMMRDKLINHAIRQAYGERMGHDGYPAFVLFFDLDFSEVDVNVHPAKHEVRFHQARFIHDFICSAIEQTLADESLNVPQADEYQNLNQVNDSANNHAQDYIQPLRNPSSEPTSSGYSTSQYIQNSSSQQYGGQQNRTQQYVAPASYGQARPSASGLNSYQTLMTPLAVNDTNSEHKAAAEQSTITAIAGIKLLAMVDDFIALIEVDNKLSCLPLKSLQQQVLVAQLSKSFSAGIVSQPLLLPVTITIDNNIADFIGHNINGFEQAGIVLELKAKKQCVIRQYPAQLRNSDITVSFNQLLDYLMANAELDTHTWISAFALLKLPSKLDLIFAQQLFVNVNSLQNIDLLEFVRLNSVSVDLTSVIKQLN